LTDDVSTVTADHERAAHFTRRLESFSDLVFGFSLSLLAGRLIVPVHASQIFGEPAGLIGFFTSFAAIVGFWFINHRMFRDYFAPERLDIALTFVELSGVALLPYALETVVRFKFAEPEPIILYDLVFIAVIGSNAVIARRGFRRRFQTWADAARRKHWRTVVIQTSIALIFVAAIVVAIVDPHAGWLPYWFIGPAIAIVRRTYKGLPAFARFTPGALEHAAESAPP
jgi:uncharacterized membrane protein